MAPGVRPVGVVEAAPTGRVSLRWQVIRERSLDRSLREGD